MLQIEHRGHPTARRNRDEPCRTADVLAAQLDRAGVEIVFGVPGGTIAPLFDALLDHRRIRTVTNRHECEAVFAAAAYAQASQKLGVVFVTSGPGVLNAINGIASAWADALPLLILAGEAPRPAFGRGAIQEGSVYALNLVGVLASITKMAAEVPDSASAPAMLRRAIATAEGGKRGPVVLSLPVDILNGRITPPHIALQVRPQFEIPSDAITRARKALGGGGRKVILAGSGARWGRGPELLRRLAERAQIPVMTTPKGKGVFPETHPLSLGVFGLGGHGSTSRYLEDGVEVTLVVGSGLGELATNRWSPLLRAHRSFIHVDIDATRIGRTYATDLAFAAPAELFLERLLEGMTPAATCAEHGVTYDLDPVESRTGASGKISAPRALWELQQVLPASTIFTTDSGSNLFLSIHYLRISEPDAFISFMGLASMGSGLPAAVGAQLARPDRRVVSVLGDGGFEMSLGALCTAAALKLPLVVVVLNDHTLGMVEAGNRAVYGRTPEYSTGPFDIGGFARACECDTATVSEPGELLRLGPLIRGRDRPLVINVEIDSGGPNPGDSRFDHLKRAMTSEQN